MVWRGIGVFAAIALAGAVAGLVATAGDDPPATQSLRVGAATLTLTGGWHMVDSTTLSNGRGRMRVVLGAPTDPSLVPPALRDEAPTGAPNAARLGGYRAWSYGSVTVLPSTRGVLGVACDRTPCASAIRSVSIARAAILTPTPDLALRLRAPTLLASLDAARANARAALRDASRLAAPSAHSAAVTQPATRLAEPAVSAPLQRLVAAHRAALAGLRPVADPPARLPTAQSAALVGALAAAEQAYDRLAHATSAAGFNAARTEVVAADRGVDGAVARLARAGAPAVQRPPASAAPRSGGGASLLTLLLVLATALLVSALAPACLRRARTRDTRPDPSLAAKPCVLAARRRTPIAPPPTYGRWNEAPRGPGAAPEGRRPDDRYGVVVDNVNVSVLE